MEQRLLSSTTPFTPPTAEDDRLSWLRLIRSPRVGPVTFHRLLAEHGSAGAALDALPAIAAAAGAAGYTPCPAGVAEDELRKGARAGLRMLRYGDADYPAPLTSLSDAPPVLWIAGSLLPLRAPALAIVGARNASSAGLRLARELAHDLANAGFTICSGLARGIDRAAHEGAGPSRTIAVLAGGADCPWPEENLDIAQLIARHGTVLSEQPPGMKPMTRHFPLRNRLISGLSRAVIVTEAAQRSGSLITARNALDQGREVLVVPGHPLDPRAEGCNLLLRDGATLIRHAGDVLEVTGRPPPRNPLPQSAAPQPAGGGAAIARAMAAAAKRRPLPSLRERILTLLSPAPVAEDQLLRQLGIPPAELAPVLLHLELDNAVERRPGGLLCSAAPAVNTRPG